MEQKHQQLNEEPIIDHCFLVYNQLSYQRNNAPQQSPWTTMPAITILSSIYQKIAPIFPPGLATSLAAAYIGEGKYFSAWRHEFIGTLLMIGLTFSPGKWIGQNSIAVAWTAHACGVIAADKIGGGPHVNPAVTCSMYSLGKCSYTEAFVRIMGAMGGGLVAFPLYKLVADTFKLTPLGGPEFDPTNDEEGIHAAFSESVAVVLLLALIYTVNWELNFGKFHYWIKQTLTALGIRYIIQTFPRAGPSINPMLATTWYIFKTGNYPDHFGHYFAYWIAPFAAAIFASALYVVYAGGFLFGKRLPFGPVKGPCAAPESKKKN